MGFGPIRRDFTLLSLSLTCCLSAMSFYLYFKTLSGLFSLKHWQPPALPCRLQQSTIGRLSLNRRVRDGNGCVPQAHRRQKYGYPIMSFHIDNSTVKHSHLLVIFLRKEVIQPHLPIRLPCYDFTPVIGPTFDGSLLIGWVTGFGRY